MNIEENGNRTPINYVLPPGINQEIDVASTNLRNLNEQIAAAVGLQPARWRCARQPSAT